MMKDFNYKICLIGMPGSGKTTLGKEIASIFDYEFIDMDSLIKKETGLKISQIFLNKGEEYFRTIETSILEKTISSDKKIIISTGGGIILRNKKILKKTYNIYLECNINTLVKRLNSSKERPLIGDNIFKDVNQLLIEREFLYKEISNSIVDSNKIKKNIINQIQEIITHENNK
ncbi:MAG: shikimate kinase [Alphaproteobacteria bacterium]|nr:shikimate kinase [Alphaproteobacteria bacterium]